MLFLCYPKCTTCRKAKAWLEEQNISFTLRDIKEENPTEEELQSWWQRTAPAEIFQYQWPAVQGTGAQGQAPYYDGGRADRLAFH